MTDNPPEQRRTSRAEKALWAGGGALVSAVLMLVVMLVVGFIQSKDASLYWTVNKPMTASISGNNYVFGSIELGNDGDVPIREWVACISFPENTSITDFDASAGLEPGWRKAGEPIPCSHTLTGRGVGDILNPGDTVSVRYFLPAAAEPTVTFKGLGATASQRAGPPPREAGDAKMGTLPLLVMSSVLCVVTISLMVALQLGARRPRLSREASERLNE